MKPARDDARTHDLAGVELGDDLLKAGVVVAHVAAGGHAARHLQEEIPGVLMRVHVKQRRHEHPAAALDDRGGKGRGARRVERGDTAAVDVHVVCGKQARILRVKYAHVCG